MFEAMWTRDNRCREVVEMARDSVSGNVELELADRLRRCKENHQGWNWREFGNVKQLSSRSKRNSNTWSP
nr:hypothetical protein CFP56_58497 [Quercus suber]